MSLNRRGKELCFGLSYVFLPYIFRKMLTFKCLSTKTRPDLPTLSLRLDNTSQVPFRAAPVFYQYIIWYW